MLQELFRIPLLGWPVYGYGLMLVVGFLAAIEAGRYMARRCGIDPDFFSNAALLALVFGVAGARLSHVLENLDLYTDPRNSALTNLWNAANISSGGLTFYGGFLLATPALIWYGRYSRVPIRRGMDVIAVCLMIGLGFGRIGCFLNGCCFGGVCTVPWAVTFPYASLPYETDYANGLVHPPEGLLDRAHRLPGTRLPALVDKRAAAADPRLAPLAAAQRSDARPSRPALQRLQRLLRRVDLLRLLLAPPRPRPRVRVDAAAARPDALHPGTPAHRARRVGPDELEHGPGHRRLPRGDRVVVPVRPP